MTMKLDRVMRSTIQQWAIDDVERGLIMLLFGHLETAKLHVFECIGLMLELCVSNAIAVEHFHATG